MCETVLMAGVRCVKPDPNPKLRVWNWELLSKKANFLPL